MFKNRDKLIPAFMKPDIRLEIRIEKHHEDTIYTSGSSIKGCVTTISRRDIMFEKLEVALIGTTTTSNISYQNDISVSTHTFLHLLMPISQYNIPDSCTLRAEQPYRIPFTFTIPHQLPSAACRHCSNVESHQRHLQLPPTTGSWKLDDQIPSAARVEYNVRARVTSKSRKSDKLKHTDMRHVVRVLPSSFGNYDYDSFGNTISNLMQTRTIREVTSCPAKVCLTAKVVRLDPILLSMDSLRTSKALISIDLEYQPKSPSAAPLQIEIKSAQLEAVTHYSRSHMNYIPEGEYRLATSDIPATSSIVSSVVTANTIRPLQWKHQVAHNLVQNLTDSSGDSSLNSTNTPGLAPICRRNVADSSEHSCKKLGATLSLDIMLPSTKKTLHLPNFYSCLISRSYHLRLVVAAGPSRTTIPFCIPLQVIVDAPSDFKINELPEYVSLQPTLATTSANDSFN